jgi:hypothetical protein
MSWFKVDDGFHCHPKVLEIGNAGAGFYVRCGSWVSQQLTDGFVPRSIALLYGDKDLIESLVETRLWMPVDGGWQMNDYLHYNRSRGEVEADRAAAAERQKRAREKARAARAAKESESRNGVSHGVTVGPSDGGSHGVSHGVTSPVSHGVTSPVSHGPPDPTRPDPTRTSFGSTEEKIPPDADASAPPEGAAKPKTKRASRLPMEFAVTPEMVAWAKANVPHVDGRVETEKFRDHWVAASGANARKLDWVAAWRNWMRNADQRSPGNRGQLALVSGQGPVRPSTTDARVAQALALAAKYEQEENQ